MTETPSGLQFEDTVVGAGASPAKGARLLVVADRRKADPPGRTIDTITSTFRK